MFYSPFPILKVASDLLFGIVLIDLVVSKSLKGKTFHRWVFILLSFYLFYAVWGIANGNDNSVMLLSLRQNKDILLCLYLAVNGSIDEKFIYKTLHIMLFLSIPLSIIQRIVSTNHTGDDVVGALGAGDSGVLTLLILFFLFSELFRRMKNSQKLFGWYWLVLIPTFLNETKIIFVLFPLLLVVTMYFAQKLAFHKIILAIAFVSAFVFGSSYTFSKLYSDQTGLAEYFTKEGIEDYFFVDPIDSDDLGRFLRLKIAYNSLKKSPFYNYLFGYGIGSAFVGTYSGTSGVFAKTVYDKRVNQGSRIQLYNFFVEFGMVGTLIFIVFLLNVIRVLVSRRKNVTLVEFKALIIIVLFLTSLPYNMFLVSGIRSFLFYYYLYVVFTNEISNANSSIICKTPKENYDIN